MDATAKKVLALLDSGDAELRKAAIRVITEIGISSKPVVTALGRCLREPSEEVQLVALKALAKLGAGDVSHMVIPLILSTGVVRDHAMIVITALGPTAVPPLQALYEEADHGGKRAVITALSLIGGKEALDFLLTKLPGEPFELQQHIATQVCEALQAMEPAKQVTVYPLVLKLLRGKPDARSPHVHITALILLGYFRGKSLANKARKILFGFADGRQLPEIRRFALLALNRLAAQTKPGPDWERFLTKMICDDDWENVAQHGLSGFRALQLPAKSLPGLVQLLKKSPHFSVHIHVFERLRGTDRPAIAEAILPFLSDSRFRVREAAEAALRQLPSGIESLFRVLSESEDLDVTQRVNSVLRDFPQEVRRKYLDRAVSRLLALFERKDQTYKSFLEFVRAVDPDPLRAKIYQKARKLKAGRSRDKWTQISAYLQLLWENHLITPDGRYLFAVALLAQSPRRLDPASRRADLGLRVIRALIYDSFDELKRKVLTDRDLGVEDYFYLGFHFSEEKEQMGDFGVAMLQHVLKKFPRHKLSPQAQQKLDLREQLPAAIARRVARRRKSSAKTVRTPSEVSSEAQTVVAPRQPITLSAGSTSAARTARKSGGTKAGKATAKPASQKSVARETASKKTASKKTASKKTASKKTASKKTASKKTASRKTASRKTASKKTASKKSAKPRKAPTKKTAAKSKKSAAKKPTRRR